MKNTNHPTMEPNEIRMEKVSQSFSSIRYVVPEIQRNINIEAVDAIYNREVSYQNKHKKYALPGTISMAVCYGVEYLIDGQHRMMAYEKLSLEYPQYDLVIVVDYYYCSTMEEVELCYKLVNTCTPNDISRMSVNIYKVKQEIITYFKTQFASYIKTSSKPITPNINLDNLANKLDTIDLSLFKLGEFALYIEEVNKFYARCSIDQFKKWNVETKTIDQIRQKSNQMFVGLYREFEWVDRIVELFHLRKNDPYVTFAAIDHSTLARRIKIVKKTRQDVWNCKYLEQPCFCCGEIIKYEEFVCGHIISVAKGGPTEKSNLKPICVKCNLDMGTMDMMEYRKSIEDQAK